MDLNRFNDMQRRAVMTTEGPVLVLAGAGSGKTSVLTGRAAYLIEKGVDPYNMLAITFTNKAANEMRERIEKLAGENVKRMVISTFHSMCARFLRSCADRIGYSNSFSIYDTSNTASLLKKILDEKHINPKEISHKYAASVISGAKNANISPELYIKDRCSMDAELMQEIFDEYTRRLLDENAMDFDDLLLNMLKVLKQDEDTRRYYSNRFKYIMVDEYQDTNAVQYQLVKIFAEKHGNIFVVGDDDQSIYGWRGADVKNILDFEKDYKNATVIKLEQNYRSHENILNAANCVIKHNFGRTGKKLWSDLPKGPKPHVISLPNEYTEAEFIARKINESVYGDKKYSDFAILYRLNSLSRVLEEKLRMYGVPYKVFGGMSFYDRREVKDILAYLTLLVNPFANTALERVINCPKRGIGPTTLTKVFTEAARTGCAALDIIAEAELHFGNAPFVKKLAAFYDMFEEIKNQAEGKLPSEIIDIVYGVSGYRMMLLAENDAEAKARMENIDSLIDGAYDYENSAEEPTLQGYLENMALITSLDTSDEGASVALMTLHTAKGLEFDTVFIAGMEENIFPSGQAVREDRMEEERRLCYVGITRAKNELYFTLSEKRTLYSSTQMNPPSRFLDEIDDSLLDLPDTGRPKQAVAQKHEPQRNMFTAAFAEKEQFKPKAKECAGAFAVGMIVEHPSLGEGKILNILGEGNNKVAVVDFKAGQKKMFLAMAPLTIKG